MKIYFLLLVTIASVLMNCSLSSKKEAVYVQGGLDSLMKQYHEERLKLFPLEATMAGDNRYNNLLPNIITESYRKQVVDFYTLYQNELLQIDRNSLSENDKINYDVLLWECNMAIEGARFRDHLLPVNQFWGAHLFIGQLASGSSIQPFKTAEDYDNWLSRLEGYLAWCDSAIVNMRKGIQEGYTIPKALAEKTIPQFSALSHGQVEDHLFYMPVKNMPAEFTEAEKARLTGAYKTIIAEKIIPAHKRISEFLQKEYLPACRPTSGIDAIPEGKAYYQYLIKLYTTTNLTADEIFALGKSEVERISNEMLVVKDQVGFKGDLKQFFEHLRTKKELTPYTQPEQVIANFNAIHEKMKPALSTLFSKTPVTPFEVRRTEAFREASASAEYNPGSPDGSRPGVFYVPIPNLKEYNILSDEALFLHEAIPGHHYQVSLQQEDTTLPDFRRFLFYSAYSEGWALYTESLGKELGLYTDPYQYFGMLSMEMHRAIRLVVDAGMHTQGWTREQAIQYAKDHEAETEDAIIAETERYMAIPGQALSYKIGQLKIRELRAKAEQELADKFNTAEFHNQILETGNVPLQILEDKIVRWIESEKAK